MKRLLIALLACLSLGQNLSAQDEAAGYLRFNTEPGEDTVAWHDPARFLDVPFVSQIAYRGMVGSATGNEITVSDLPIWTPDAFATDYFVEIVSGTNAGMRFTISANSANSLSVNLDGGSLAGIAANVEIIVAPFWTLNSLFPEGLNLTATTEILFAPDFAITYVYRSDLGRWIDTADTATDVGDYLIPHDVQLVIRQSAATPIKPFVWGFHSPTPPLQATINYLQVGNNDFANGFNLTTSAGSLGIDSTGADGETNEPQHGGNATTASVWFNYTASQNGSLTVTSENSAFDTVLAAYSGAAVGSLTPLGSNDDSATGTWSELTFPVSAGQTYRIALDGKGGATGTGYLNWVFSDVAAATTMENWAAANHGLSGDALLYSADDDGDTLTLLEEYAFNLDPTANNIAVLVSGTGTSGSPLILLEGDRLEVEYLRRRNDSSLTYTAQFSSNLLTGYAAATESETVTIISAEFERVVIRDSETTDTATARFGRVKLEATTP